MSTGAISDSRNERRASSGSRQAGVVWGALLVGVAQGDKLGGRVPHRDHVCPASARHRLSAQHLPSVLTRATQLGTPHGSACSTAVAGRHPECRTRSRSREERMWCATNGRRQSAALTVRPFVVVHHHDHPPPSSPSPTRLTHTLYTTNANAAMDGDNEQNVAGPSSKKKPASPAVYIPPLVYLPPPRSYRALSCLPSSFRCCQLTQF